MSGNAELNFKTKTENLDWFKNNLPDAYSDYLTVKDTVKKSNFTGVSRLIGKEKGEPVENFLSFVSELNLANLLLSKKVGNLGYEIKPGFDIDFSFDDIDLSVKNIGTKNYERVEDALIEELKESGGGSHDLTHKNFSNIKIEVEKNGMGTFTYSRTETGHSGFLDSDMAQMSSILENIGKFESKIQADGRKKILVFVSYTADFNHYHAVDIGFWYFNRMPKGYNFIFNNNMSKYLQLLKQKSKLNNIDAIIFIFPPRPIIWPDDSLAEVVNERARTLIYTKNKDFFDLLKTIFI
jgi:hypothetical protein